VARRLAIPGPKLPILYLGTFALPSKSSLSFSELTISRLPFSNLSFSKLSFSTFRSTNSYSALSRSQTSLSTNSHSQTSLSLCKFSPSKRALARHVSGSWPDILCSGRCNLGEVIQLLTSDIHSRWFPIY